jgi:glutathione S-transferase
MRCVIGFAATRAPVRVKVMAAQAVQIIGSFISPYVRKVLVVLNLKCIPYEIDPIIPFMGDDRFSRWIEEFADTRIGEVLIWRLFNQRVINRFVWGEQTDQTIVDRAIAEEIPGILDYLEPLAPATGFLFGALSIADISVAAFFRNAAFARYSIDPQRWPKLAAHVTRVLDLPAFVQLRAFEELSCRTPIAQHREALRAAGAPIMADTYGTATPRRGVLQI